MRIRQHMTGNREARARVQENDAKNKSQIDGVCMCMRINNAQTGLRRRNNWEEKNLRLE